MRWFLFEDKVVDDLSPVALARPVFELVCGRECLRRRMQRWFPTQSWGVQIRPWLRDVYAEEHPDCEIGDCVPGDASPTLLINGRWMPAGRLRADDVTLDNLGVIDNQTAWILLHPEELQLLNDVDFDDVVTGIARDRRHVSASGRMIERPWDLVNHNGRQLELDFIDEGVSQPRRFPDVRILGCPEETYISELSEIDPYVVIDTRNGPVSVDRDVRIQSFTRIEGPCHISRGAKIFRGAIREGTTIGEHCRVGGEVEQSILHSYVNKYHEGYFGHSYVCPWVNLGANSTTSDLRNDYGTVRVPLDGTAVESGTLKVGSFIGDHTRAAIDSMFNTGSSIGVMTLVLPAGRLLPRYIPSFCNISFGYLADNWPLDQAIDTARIAMQRRGCELTAAGEALYRHLHSQTADERQTSVDGATHQRLKQ